MKNPNPFAMFMKDNSLTSSVILIIIYRIFSGYITPFFLQLTDKFLIYNVFGYKHHNFLHQ